MDPPNRGTEEMVEPSRNDILRAARISLRFDRLVEEEKAQGRAVGTCMAWMARGFACLGFPGFPRFPGVPGLFPGDPGLFPGSPATATGRPGMRPTRP